MSGPALKQLHAHRAIHDAAHGEAEELTGVFRRFVEEGRWQQARETAALVVEHWHTRTLRHAAEEESGFYREVAQQDPDRAGDIGALTRDHDLMRQLVAEAEARLADVMPLASPRGESSEPVEAFREIALRFEMLLWLVERHSREEEKRLLESPRETQRSRAVPQGEERSGAHGLG
ncbi:hemerythrin domain-containing protein [Alicyclobacillus sp.]|uniref:hemerythrin domain-containing protein n=1 Tax=Alicyclobacillus sp. TaxID=61169 RepID=UPI0025C2845C|nr:hemerythrin domain-containing protein [Alicyclobacillus sp.]MCL6517200.1 hemerythrin domain-containing protein [Alicyclobacillus sp.]